MDAQGRAAQELREILKPMVCMFVQQIRPVEDELSVSRAQKEYGRRWIDSQKRAGNLSIRYKGNKIILSRAEIESLIAVEQEKPRIIVK